MAKISEQYQKDFTADGNIKSYEEWESDQNLFGFFALLYKVDQRLKKEKNINNSVES
jgi:hypothetical protein